MSADSYAARSAPQNPFNRVVRDVSEMKDLGLFERGSAAGGLQKLALVAPDPSDLSYFALGMVLVAVVSLCRFRFAQFPIHPVLFLVWGTYPSNKVWSSFLIGWAVKSLVVRFGGGRVYQHLKPLFVGLIVAELFICAVAVIIGMLVYAATGSPPDISFGVMAG
jgi:hypothetical protein